MASKSQTSLYWASRVKIAVVKKLMVKVLHLSLKVSCSAYIQWWTENTLN